MNVAIVGAGALGWAYGVLLAKRGDVRVTFVVRSAKVSDTRAIQLERVENEDVLRLESPVRSDRVPGDADLIIVAVRADQLDEPLFEILRERDDVPIVVLTPMMPRDFERTQKALGARVLAGMPSVTSYVMKEDEEQIVVRYWMPLIATTLVDLPKKQVDSALAEFIATLIRAGVSARLEMGVHEINPASTVMFIPLAMAIDAASGIDALLEDRELLSLAIDAANEGGELALRIGKPAVWSAMLMKFVSPATLRIGVALAKRRSAEGVRYVEMHFGRKLHAQNIAMAETIADLAREKGVPHRAIDLLLAKLREVKA